MATATAVRQLNIGYDIEARRDFTLKPDWMTSTNAILAKKRAGKSWLAGVLEEELCKAGLQWCSLDPVSAHWGIREKYPVVVFGGPKADIPLRREMGADIAKAALEEGFSFIIDLKRESGSIKRQVVTDFSNYMLEHCERPLHVFIEECTEFVPQTIRPDQTVAFDAIDRLVRLGGGSGLGITLISQRTAKVNKDVLEQIDTLFVLRMTGPHDVKAVRDWLKEKELTDKIDEVARSLARLPTGTAWVWSGPEYLDFFGQVQVRARETFHAGGTPQVGQKMTARLVEVNVDALRKRFDPKPAAVVDGKAGAVSANAKAAIETAQREAAAAQQETKRLGRALEDQGAAFEEAKRLLGFAEKDAQAARDLKKALLGLLGGAPAGVLAAPKGQAPLDLEALTQAVLARLPKTSIVSGGMALAVAAPDVLRKKFQREEADRLIGKLRSLDKQTRDILSLLESTGKVLSLQVLCQRLGVSTGGDPWRRVKDSVEILHGLGFLENSKGHGWKGALQAKIAADLTAYGASEDDAAQVYHHALHALAEGE